MVGFILMSLIQSLIKRSHAYAKLMLLFDIKIST